MGVVYRARDTRLGREVAVKVLPDEVAGDEDRLRRFEKEARAVSALNHPNILDLHDIGNHQGLPFIVTELLEGATLRQQLASVVPIPRALEYAKQIAAGLAAAHEKGIVHRDLKPLNVFVTHDGRVKILDFGLAKVVRLPIEITDGSDAVTLSQETEARTLVGTVDYMSPEQIRGLPADRRSDVFSFGIILYELLAGTRPFRGDTSVDMMTAILTKDPFEAPPTAAHALPPLMTRVIRHCLEKKPEDRFQSARDMLFALDALSSLSEAETLRPRPRRWMLVAALGLALLTLYAAGLWVGRRSESGSGTNVSFVPLTSRRGYVPTARFAMDGHTVMYGGAWEGRPTELFTTRADRAETNSLLPGADILSISPSGELAVLLGRRYVNGWASSGTLARMTLGLGAPREILEGVQDSDWSRQGGDLVITRRVEGRHRLEWPLGEVIHSTGGWISCPRVSPSGDRVGFFEHPVHGDDRGAVAVGDQRGTIRVLSDGWISLSGLAWSPAGDEIWFAGAASVSGNFRQLYAVDLTGKVRPLLRAPGSLVLHDVARDGRMLVSRDSLRSIVTGLGPGDRGEREFGWTDSSFAHDISADGRLLLLSEQGLGTSALYDVFLRRTDGSPPTRLGEGVAMALSPDGRWALTVVGTSPPELVLLPTRAGSARHLPRGRMEQYSYVASWFPDGERVLFQGHEAGRQERLFVQSVIGGEPAPLTPEGVHLTVNTDPISPDGRTVAAVGADGRVRLYDVDGGAPTIVPALAAGEEPLRWSRDGQSLFVIQWLGAAHVRVQRVDLKSRRKTLVRDVAPQVPGVMSIVMLQAANECESYAYTYMQRLSDLYVVTGIK